MNVLQKIALVIAIIGAINWLIIGIFDFNIIFSIFGSLSNVFSRIIYVLIGLAGLITISILFTYFDKKTSY